MAEMTAADIAAVTNHGYGYGCNDGFGFGFGGNAGGFILGLLFGGIANGGGIFGGENRSNVATTEDLASGFNFSGVNNKLNEITAGIAGVNQNLSNAICQLGYQDAQHTYELGSKIDNCCCGTQRAIDSVKFDMANYAAASNANTVAVGQKILDKLCENEKAAMAARIQQLELQQALCGVPKILPATVYGAVPYNGYYSGCGYGCGNI